MTMARYVGRVVPALHIAPLSSIQLSSAPLPSASLSSVISRERLDGTSVLNGDLFRAQHLFQSQLQCIGRRNAPLLAELQGAIDPLRLDPHRHRQAAWCSVRLQDLRDLARRNSHW